MIENQLNGEYLAPVVKVMELSVRGSILFNASDPSDEGGGGGYGEYGGRDADPDWF